MPLKGKEDPIAEKLHIEGYGFLPVLDKGYVRVVDVMGSDLSFVNAARASYAKESDELDDKDVRLLRFLLREGHLSPFRHAFATFEIKAPLMVARQWWKYVVASDHTFDSSWNEASRRYITMEPEFHNPSAWRQAPANSKQGSGDNIDDPIAVNLLNTALERYVTEGQRLYDWAMNLGVAAEQARLFLPAYGMYTLWRWSTSFQSITHFLKQRLEDDAQKEIREYAVAVKKLVTPYFPVTMKLLFEESK